MNKKYLVSGTIIILFVSFLNMGLTNRKKAGDPFEEADNFYNIKRYEDAVSKYRKVIEAYDDTTKFAGYDQDYNKQFILTYAYYRSGECAFNLNKYAEAIENYNKSLANDSYLKWEEKNWYKIGLSYFYQEKYLDAVNYFKKLTGKYAQGPNGPLAQFYMGFSFDLMRKPDEAKKTFEKFMELYPNHPWNNKVKEKLGIK